VTLSLIEKMRERVRGCIIGCRVCGRVGHREVVGSSREKRADVEGKVSSSNCRKRKSVASVEGRHWRHKVAGDGIPNSMDLGLGRGKCVLSVRGKCTL